jgi:exodeoxyribonuclease VIII
LVHTLILEPSKLADEFYVISQKQRPARGTNPYDKMIAEAAGRNTITVSELTLSKNIAYAIHQNTTAMNLLSDTKVEQSIFWNHESGLQCKARPDAWRDNIVIDLKTTADASFKAFQYSFLNYGYYLQGAMIKRALNALDIDMTQFIVLCVEKKPPYATGIYIMDGKSLERGEIEFDALMHKLAQCYEKNEWPCYETQFMSLPDWYNNKESI